VLGRLALAFLSRWRLAEGGRQYVFDTRILTNHQPYFAAYIKVQDLLKFTDRLELVQDEWGYLLLWATLGIAAIFAFTLVLFPWSSAGAPSSAAIPARPARCSISSAWA
jgi:hypothetical protein